MKDNLSLESPDNHQEKEEATTSNIARLAAKSLRNEDASILIRKE